MCIMNHMKKTITGLLVGTFLLPSLVFAQTTDNTSLIAILQQLVVVLEQEIQSILASRTQVTSSEISLATSTLQTQTPLFGTASVTSISPEVPVQSSPPQVQSTPMGISIVNWDGKSPYISNDGKAVLITVTGNDGQPASSTPISIKEGNRTIIYLGLETSTDTNGQLSFVPTEIGSGSHDLIISVPSLNLNVPITFIITYPQE